MSDTEIEKGSRGITEIGRALEGMRVGISCLTPENLEAPWLAFEAGALSKSIDDKTRLCTYLFGGLNFQDVKPPLSMFQATRADKEDTRKLIHAINRAVQDAPISEPDLDELFDAMWPNLEKSLSAIPEPEQRVEVKRSMEEMVTEILEWVRTEPQRQLMSDITRSFEASRSARGPTVDLRMDVNGKPVTVAVAGLSDLVRSALVDTLRREYQERIERAISQSPQSDTLRGSPEVQKEKETAERQLEEMAERLDVRINPNLQLSVHLDDSAKA
jgi:hypothetical protein